MLSARVQQSLCLVGLAWLEHDSHLARLAGFVVHQKTVGHCGFEERDQEFIITEISPNCYLMDVNFTTDQF